MPSWFPHPGNDRGGSASHYRQRPGLVESPDDGHEPDRVYEQQQRANRITHCDYASSTQSGEDLLGERAGDSRYPREIVDACRLNALEAAEVREKRLPLLDAHTCDLLERGPGSRLGAPRAVPLNRE